MQAVSEISHISNLRLSRNDKETFRTQSDMALSTIDWKGPQMESAALVDDLVWDE